MHMKLLDPESLSRGKPRQVEALRVLRALRVFEELKDYTPVLAGTLPLDLDVAGSDLDVICSADNLETFAELVRARFGTQPGFALEFKVLRDLPSVIARFRSDDFPIEIFAQSKSVYTQNAVVHLLVEARLLSFAPAEVRDAIRSLKASGLATEPAFAQVFEIEGDAYEELLKLARLPDHELLTIAHRFHFRLH